MLDKGSFKILEYLQYINNVYVNEHGDGYYFDISKEYKDIRKIRPKTIRLTLDCWNVKVPRTNSLMEITELLSTCKIGRIVYNYQDY